jgi:hypothetical protein
VSLPFSEHYLPALGVKCAREEPMSSELLTPFALDVFKTLHGDFVVWGGGAWIFCSGQQ